MKIYIVGYMYCGKTSVGKRLARRLGYNFMDLDDEFERRFKLSITDFFGRYDETAFRKLEHEVLLSTKDVDNCVISTGGGTPCHNNNMDFIKENGLSVYLEADADLILSRRANSKKRRPVLEAMPAGEVETFVDEQLAARKPFYSMADIRCDARDVSIDNLANILKQKLL